MEDSSSGSNNFGAVIATIGSILIACGVAWIIAMNWREIPSYLKILILFIATTVSLVSAVVLKNMSYPKTGQSLLILGSLLYTLSIFLIAQIFSSNTTSQGYAWLWFLSLFGVIAIGLLLKSRIIVFIGLGESLLWMIFQAVAFGKNLNGSDYLGILIPFFVATVFLIIIQSIIVISKSEPKKEYIFLAGTILTLLIYSIALGFLGEASLILVSMIVLSGLIILLASSYLSESYLGISVSIIKFSIWIFLLFYTVQIKINKISSLGEYLLIFIAFNLLLYGLYLSHNSLNHKFSQIYKWFSIMHLIVFSFLLSFQSILEISWYNGFSISTESAIFIVAYGIFSAVVFIVGAIIYSSKNSNSLREIGIFTLFIILLTSIILVSATLESSNGYCYQKSCYDFKDKQSCNLENLESFDCVWNENYENCEQLNCNFFTQPSSCNSAKVEGISCMWNAQSNYCYQAYCNTFINQTSCENSPDSLNCYWHQDDVKYAPTTIDGSIPPAQPYGYCQQNYSRDIQIKESYSDCYQLNGQKNSCVSNNNCKWQPSPFARSSSGLDIPITTWLVWAFSNVIFLIIILSLIGYGTYNKSPALVNIGIAFFILDIISRYIGFIIDFGGYTGLGVIFIIGGILLLLGGFLIERWRRNLVRKAKEINTII
jgi:uncharacterized membrane protein